MKRFNRICATLLLGAALMQSCDFASPGTFKELSRIYSPDSTRFLLKYNYDHGAWDGGRSWFVSIMNTTDSIRPKTIGYSYSSYDFDNIYWSGNDTVVIEENYTEFLSREESALQDTVLKGVQVKIVQRDPIDSSFTRKILHRETSPNGKNELIAYRYVKPENGNYFLNISVINKGDSIPRFGNFYISRWDFDCFTDLHWDSANVLDIKVSEACYHTFSNYLVKNRADIQFKVQISDKPGNIQ